MFAGSKTQEEKDRGRLSAGGETPVIADGDGEQGREVLLLWHRKMRNRRCTLS